MSKHIYGIYCKGEICYVGKTRDMRVRWNEYRSQHKNSKCKNYNTKIFQYMREQGFDNFSHEIIETVPEEYGSQAEGMWYHTFKDLGFDLKNTCVPGNGNSSDRGTIAYQNHLARNREQIPCPVCGRTVRRCNMPKHQRTYHEA